MPNREKVSPAMKFQALRLQTAKHIAERYPERRDFVSREERTPEYEQAVQALKSLDPNIAGGAFAEALWQYELLCVLRNPRSTEGEPDFKLSKRGVCVHRLRGKRCDGIRGDCLPPGADHTVLIMCGRSPHSLITQPYRLGARDLRGMIAWSEEHTLHMRIDGRGSWHFPARTLLVEFRPNEVVEAEWERWRAERNTEYEAQKAAGEAAGSRS